MKTSELSGAALGWAVSIADGWVPEKCSDAKGEYLWLFKNGEGRNPKYYRPSVNWAQSGAIIQREGIAIDCVRCDGKIDSWVAGLTHEDKEYGGLAYAEETGKTPLIAAMRCYVASKLGDEVEIPEELNG